MAIKKTRSSTNRLPVLMAVLVGVVGWWHFDQASALSEALASARAQRDVLGDAVADLRRDPSGFGMFRSDGRDAGRRKPGKNQVVFIGDSITGSWNLERAFSGYSFAPINRGINGQTSAQMLGRFYQDVLALKPRGVVILAGTNDAWEGIDPAWTEDNLAAMVQEARGAGLEVLLGELPPMHCSFISRPRSNDALAGSPEFRVRQLNAWIDRRCSQGGCIAIPYHSALTDARGEFDQRYFRDCVHPNSAGFERMAPLVLAAWGRRSK
jgi:lysophospholipase L1-like esterase